MKKVTIHASCIAINNKAILLLGKSGSGKSDLALRLIDGGAQLITDDYVEITACETTLTAAPPQKLEGLIEAQGVGILTMPFIHDIEIKLAINLIPREEVERLPEPQFFSCLEQQIPLLSLCSHDASTPTKIRFYIKQIE